MPATFTPSATIALEIRREYEIDFRDDDVTIEDDGRVFVGSLYMATWDGLVLTLDRALGGKRPRTVEIRAEDPDSARIDSYEADILSGRVFLLAAASARSVIGYRPAISRDKWAAAVAIIAHMGAESDALAAVAASILTHAPNLYGTAEQGTAMAYDAAYAALREYVDVIGLSGPEPGRRSDRTRDYTLRERVSVLHYLDDFRAALGAPHGIGWALAAVAKRVGYSHR